MRKAAALLAPDLEGGFVDPARSSERVKMALTSDFGPPKPNYKNKLTLDQVFPK